MIETSNAMNQVVESDPTAERHEAKVQAELNAQYLELRRQAQGIFEAIRGRRGATTEAYWEAAFAKAHIDYASGKFLIQRLGADRQLDLPLVATLTLLRQGILEGIENPTMADNMMADTAIIAYRNFLRVQAWVGSTSLIVQSELFGQEPLEAIHGNVAAMVIEGRVDQLQQTLMPLLDRAQRMMICAIDRLAASRNGKPHGSITVGKAGQVNVGSVVNNQI